MLQPELFDLTNGVSDNDPAASEPLDAGPTNVRFRTELLQLTTPTKGLPLNENFRVQLVLLEADTNRYKQTGVPLSITPAVPPMQWRGLLEHRQRIEQHHRTVHLPTNLRFRARLLPNADCTALDQNPVHSATLDRRIDPPW